MRNKTDSNVVIQEKEVAGFSLRKNALVLITGSSISQLVALALMPFLTYLYTPEEFGVFGFFVFVSGLGAQLATLKYCKAIILCKDSSEAVSLAAICIRLSFVTATILSVLIAGLAKWFPELFGAFSPLEWFGFSFVFISCNGIGETLYGLLLRKRMVKHLAFCSAARQVGTILCQLLSFYIFAEGLAVGATVVLVICMLLTVAWIDFGLNGRLVWRKADLKGFSDFPRYFLPQDFVYYLSAGIPIFIYSSLHAEVYVGAYYLANKILQQPANIAGRGLRNAFLAKFSEQALSGADSSAHRLCKDSAVKFSLAIIPVVTLIAIATPFFVSRILGEKWELAATIIPYFVLSAGAQLAIIPAVSLAHAMRMQREKLFFELFQLFLRSLVFLVPIYLGMKLEYCLLFFSFSDVLCAAFFTWYVIASIKVKSRVKEAMSSGLCE